MIIDDLHVRSTRSRPAEADAILIVHPDAVLARPVTLERFKPVSGRHAKVVQTSGDLQLPELSTRDVLNAVKPPDAPSCRQGFRIGIAERNDHQQLLTPRVNNVKRD